MAKKKAKPYLKVRTYTGGDPVANLWLIFSDGAAEFSLLSGEMTIPEMEEVMDFFSELKVSIALEKSPLPGLSLSKPKVANKENAKKVTKKKQQGGFDL